MSFGHGGYRAGSGRPKSSINKQILEGSIDKGKFMDKVMDKTMDEAILKQKTQEEIDKLKEVESTEVVGINNGVDIVDADENDMPQVEEYLKRMERDGKPLGADYEYKKLWKWLKLMRCEKLVNPKLIELYSMNAARYRQCHEKISDLGLVVKNAQGNPIASPFAMMAMNFEKAMNNELMIINQIVKNNEGSQYLTYTEQDLEMEKLLSH